MALGYEFLLALALVYGTSYLLKFLETYDVPVLAVEILAGILFGAVLGVVGPHIAGYEVLTSVAAFGLLMIMFDAGLELDPYLIREDPSMIAKMAALTFVLPFLSGVGLALFLGLPLFAAFLVGITISTTSIGLVYPLLEDTDRGQHILAVTVMNDVLSVVALAYGVTLVTATRPLVGIGTVTAVLLLFLVVVPLYLVDPLSRFMDEWVFDNPVKFGLFFTLAFAVILEKIGIHAILGAFFAGLLIAEITHEGHRVERSMKPVLQMTAPVFFFYVGMNVSFGALAAGGSALLGLVLLLGIGSKMIGAGLGGWLTGSDRTTTLLLAAAVPGRLSISVAAAEVGRAEGIIGPELYDAFILLSVVSVFLAVLMFRQVMAREA
ncbi:MAG: cation:proton antiporter [Candidatus Nanohaloarchaea archaeon]